MPRHERHLAAFRPRAALQVLVALLSGNVEVAGVTVVGPRSRREKVAEGLRLLQRADPERCSWLARTANTVVVATDRTEMQVRPRPSLIRLAAPLVDRAQPYQLAAYLCHAARHCELYKEAKARAGAEPDPLEYYWHGAEADCVALECAVLSRLGATEEERRWVTARDVAEDEMVLWNAAAGAP